MAKIITTCILCEEKSKSDSAPVSCPICGVDLDSSQTEILLKKTACIAAIGANAYKGTLLLTNKRVFWLRHSETTYIGNPGLSVMIIDAIASKLFPKPKVMRFSFNLDEITDLEIVQVGPFKQIKMTAGDEVVVLDIKNHHLQEWIDAISEAKVSLMLSK